VIVGKRGYSHKMWFLRKHFLKRRSSDDKRFVTECFVLWYNTTMEHVHYAQAWWRAIRDSQRALLRRTVRLWKFRSWTNSRHTVLIERARTHNTRRKLHVAILIWTQAARASSTLQRRHIVARFLKWNGHSFGTESQAVMPHPNSLISMLLHVSDGVAVTVLHRWAAHTRHEKRLTSETTASGMIMNTDSDSTLLKQLSLDGNTLPSLPDRGELHLTRGSEAHNKLLASTPSLSDRGVFTRSTSLVWDELDLLHDENHFLRQHLLVAEQHTLQSAVQLSGLTAKLQDEISDLTAKLQDQVAQSQKLEEQLSAELESNKRLRADLKTTEKFQVEMSDLTEKLQEQVAQSQKFEEQLFTELKSNKKLRADLKRTEKLQDEISNLTAKLQDQVAESQKLEAQLSAELKSSKRLHPDLNRQAQDTFETQPEFEVLKRLKADPMNLVLTLGIDFSEVGLQGSEKRNQFECILKDELSEASSLPASSFVVKHMSPGSVIVDVVVIPAPYGPAPADAAAEIERQFSDINSTLRAGSLTGKIKSVALSLDGCTLTKLQASIAVLNNSHEAIIKSMGVEIHRLRTGKEVVKQQLATKMASLSLQAQQAEQEKADMANEIANKDARIVTLCHQLENLQHLIEQNTQQMQDSIHAQQRLRELHSDGERERLELEKKLRQLEVEFDEQNTLQVQDSIRSQQHLRQMHSDGVRERLEWEEKVRHLEVELSEGARERLELEEKLRHLEVELEGSEEISKDLEVTVITVIAEKTNRIEEQQRMSTKHKDHVVELTQLLSECEMKLHAQTQHLIGEMEALETEHRQELMKVEQDHRQEVHSLHCKINEHQKSHQDMQQTVVEKEAALSRHLLEASESTMKTMSVVQLRLQELEEVRREQAETCMSQKMTIQTLEGQLHAAEMRLQSSNLDVQNALELAKSDADLQRQDSHEKIEVLLLQLDETRGRVAMLEKDTNRLRADIGTLEDQLAKAALEKIAAAEDARLELSELNRLHVSELMKKEQEILQREQAHNSDVEGMISNLQARIQSVSHKEEELKVLSAELMHKRQQLLHHGAINKQLKELCLELVGVLRQNVFPPPPRSQPHKHKSRTTLGITVFPTSHHIDQILVGGPAYYSKVLESGDEILEVDGAKIEPNMLANTLLGSDIPGTFVNITVRQVRGEIKTVKLKRISSESMSEQRLHIFEIINEAKNAADRHRASDLHQMLENILEKWSEESRCQLQHDEKLAENLVRKDSRSQALLRKICVALTQTLEDTTDSDNETSAQEAATFWQLYNNAFYSAFLDAGVHSGSSAPGQPNVYTSFCSQVRSCLCARVCVCTLQ